MRLDALEREALKYALNDFNGDVYLFGSRIDDTKRAIILLKESIKKFNPYKTEKKYTPDELEYYDSLSFRGSQSKIVIRKL